MTAGVLDTARLDAELARLLDDAAFQAIVAALHDDPPEPPMGAPQPVVRTAHPLVAKTTAELLTEAGIASGPSTAARPDGAAVSPLRGIWRILPDRLLALRRPLGLINYRHVTIAEHLELTARVLQHSGWARTPGRLRTRSGRRCILGAQAALYTMEYGDHQTAVAAGSYLDAVLRARRQAPPFWRWNDTAATDLGQVLQLVEEAAALARANNA